MSFADDVERAASIAFSRGQTKFTMSTAGRTRQEIMAAKNTVGVGKGWNVQIVERVFGPDVIEVTRR